MRKSYVEKNAERLRFRFKVPKKLWDCLPKVIKRDLKVGDQEQAEVRCKRCGQRLKDLFERAGKGMVARTILRELVKEICSVELTYSLQAPVIVEPARPMPANGELLQGFLGQLLQSLNITLNLPKPVQAETIPLVPPPVHPLQKTVELYLKEKGSNTCTGLTHINQALTKSRLENMNPLSFISSQSIEVP